MTILLTGASGFVGQNLKPFLEERLQIVHGLSLRGKWEENLTEQYDVIIHLAGKAHDISNTSNPAEYFQINTELTKKLFDFFLQSTARDFIYFSSVKAVADTVSGTLTEEAPPIPLTPYGQSKLKAEEYLLNKELPKNKRLFILRPCMIHGPGNKGNLNLLYKVVESGIPYPLAAFENERSFLSIRNLLFVIEQLLLQPDIPGDVYNIADDEPLATTEVVKLIGQATHTRTRLWAIPPALIKTVARLGDKLHLPLNSERLKKIGESYRVSNGKLKKALNISSFPVSSSEGLLETIKSFENTQPR